MATQVLQMTEETLTSFFEKNVKNSIKEMITETVNEVFNKAFNNSFNNSFDKSFNNSFDNSFDKAFNNSFDKVFNNSFDNSFDKAFNNSFDKAFNNSFDKAFDNAFSTHLNPRFEAIEERLTSLEHSVAVIEYEHGNQLKILLDAATANLEKHEEIINSINYLKSKDYDHDVRIAVLEELSGYPYYFKYKK